LRKRSRSMRERARARVCVCVRAREKETETETETDLRFIAEALALDERERERVCVCVCVCVRERERERGKRERDLRFIAEALALDGGNKRVLPRRSRVDAVRRSNSFELLHRHTLKIARKREVRRDACALPGRLKKKIRLAPIGSSRQSTAGFRRHIPFFIPV
jgi:hypothetical protein